MSFAHQLRKIVSNLIYHIKETTARLSSTGYVAVTIDGTIKTEAKKIFVVLLYSWIILFPPLPHRYAFLFIFLLVLGVTAEAQTMYTCS